MTITSQYDNKCKDCGTEYKKGDKIDTNGNESPNKMGEMKDHWCKNGKNCQGAMQLGSHPATLETKFPPSQTPKLNSVDMHSKYNQVKAELEYSTTMAVWIKCIKDCELMGIEDNISRGMYFNNVIRNLQ